MFAIWPLCSLISSRHSWVTDIARSYRQIRFFLLFHLDVFLEPFSEPFFARLSWQNERTFNRRLDGRKLSKVWSSLTSRVTSGSESLNVPIAKFRGVFPQIRGLSNIGAGHKAHTIDDLLVNDDEVFVIFRNLGQAERSYYFCKELCTFKKV